MKKFLVAFFCLALLPSAFSQANLAKIGLLKRFVSEENWDGAIMVGTQLLKMNNQDYEALYYTSIAYISADRPNPEEALTLLTRMESDPKLSKYKDYKFWVGRAQLGSMQPEKALESFESFKTELNGKKPNPILDFNLYYSQAKNAQKYMATPLPVVYKNLGEAINTEVDEAMPFISAEGDVLYFSARRSGNVGGKVDPYDGKPYQDIWFSVWDTINNTWGEAENLVNVNSDEHESIMSISPDGSVLFVYKNVVGKTASGDIWYSRKKGDNEWSRPTEYEGPFNTSYYESSASLANGGKRLFFISERPDGKSLGQGDIWVCDRVGRREWGKPVNAGPKINTPYDENSVYVAVDGKTVFFTSNSDKSMGGYDIFRTTYVNGVWTDPVNLGYPINTCGDERSFCLSADGKKAYISARRSDGYGELDIYEIDLSNIDIFGTSEGNTKTEGLSIFKGFVKDENGNAIENATLTIYDEAGAAKITTIETDETGAFFVTLEGNFKYSVTIQADGKKTSTQKISLGKKEGSQPFTLSKEFKLIAE